MESLNYIVDYSYTIEYYKFNSIEKIINKFSRVQKPKARVLMLTVI